MGKLRSKRIACAVTLLAVVFAGLASCTAQRKHAILSFLFDGVPPLGSSREPKQTKTLSPEDDDDVIGAVREFKPATGSTHEPYRTKQCTTCHGSQFSMSLAKETRVLCRECHGDFLDQFAFVHGPAGRFECQVCHDPHESDNQHLLSRTQPDLCLWCHQEQEVMASPYHESGGERLCSECHDPHGGDDPFFLVAAQDSEGQTVSVTNEGEN